MDRARETLVEAELMAQTGHWNACVNRLCLLLRSDCAVAQTQSISIQTFGSAQLIESSLCQNWSYFFYARNVVSRPLRESTAGRLSRSGTFCRAGGASLDPRSTEFRCMY